MTLKLSWASSSLRTKKGLGVGKTPGKIVPDGIELKLTALGRDALAPASLVAEAEALEEMAYVIAAVADVAGAKPPAKFEGKQTKKDWITWTQDTRVGADEFAKAVKGKEAQEIKAAAKKLNTVCSTCHEMFK